MNVALPKPWTIERFLAWAGTQDERYEFDGLRPVAMTGGSADHNRIALNVHVALRQRLRGTPCTPFGPDLGIQTTGNAVRYPDALVTCKRFSGKDRLAPDPVAVFEVLSPDSGRRDRIQKTHEYAAVPSIRHYVILESSGVGVFALHRETGDAPWIATTLMGDDRLALTALGYEIPVAEFYEDVDFGDDGDRAYGRGG
jgi:Uma2 family endonuclease